MTTGRRITRAVAAALGGGAVLATTAMVGAPGSVAALAPATAAHTTVQAAAAHTTVRAADPADGAEVPFAAEVALRTVSPAAIGPGDTLVLAGSVTNVGTEPLENPQALPRYSTTALETRDQIDLVRSDPSFRRGSRPAAPFDEFAELLQPGDSADFSLPVTVDDLGLGAAGVYVVGIDIRADDTSTTAATNRITVGEQRTVVTYLPDDEPLPRVPVATVWGLETEPRIQADGTLTDDDLAVDLATDGRLGSVLAGAAGAPVTWLVDPDLLVTAEAMTTPYEVTTADGPAPGRGTDVADQWWEAFHAARSGGQTLLMPMADPDVESFAASETALAGRLLDESVAGTDQVAERLADGDIPDESAAPPDGPGPGDGDDDGEADPDGDTAPTGTSTDEPADAAALTGTADQATEADGPIVRISDRAIGPETLDAYAAAGVEQMIVSASGDGTSDQPFAEIATDTGPIEAVVTDAGLGAALLGAGAGADPDAAAAALAQRWRAETAMIALEARREGVDPQPLVAAAPFGWAPSPTTVDAAIDVWTGTPWIHASTLADLDRPDQRPEIDPAQGAPVGALPEVNVTATAELDATARHYTSMLADASDDGSGLTEALDLTVLRSASRSWRADPSAGLQFASAVTERLAADIAEVTLSVPPQVTLSSRTGVFPLTVDNPLDYPVSVRIAVTSANPDRLRVDAVTEQVVDAGTRATVNVEAEAFSNGRVPVRLGLVAADGTPLGGEQRTIITATDYGAVGWIVVAAGGVMLTWSFARRMWRRRHPRPDDQDPNQDPNEDPAVESAEDPDDVRADVPTEVPADDESGADDGATTSGDDPSGRSRPEGRQGVTR